MDTQLKILREKQGFTQVAIANIAQIGERAYQRYESGERVPNAHTAQLLAKALNSTVEKLFPLPERQFREKKKKPDGNRACLHQNNSIQK